MIYSLTSLIFTFFLLFYVKYINCRLIIGLYRYVFVVKDTVITMQKETSEKVHFLLICLTSLKLLVSQICLKTLHQHSKNWLSWSCNIHI